MTRPARTAREVLVAAQWILANVGWTRAALARRPDGTSIGRLCDLKNGSCFCALGAVLVTDAPLASQLFARSALYRITGGRDTCSVAEFNDAPDTTLADILALYDRAIAAAGDE